MLKSKKISFLIFSTLTISGVIAGFFCSEIAKTHILASSKEKSGRVNSRSLEVNSHSLDMAAPRTNSLEELAKQSDLVVVGKTGSVVNEGSFWGYDASGNLITTHPASVGDESPLAMAKFVDYEVKVQQVLKDDGSLNAGKILILRLPDLGFEGDAPDQNLVISEPEPNRSKPKSKNRPDADMRRRVFILKQNPDKKTYGSYYFSQGLLIVDGSTVTESNGKRSDLKIGASSNPNQFIQELKQVIEKQRVNLK
jgi:hypothetical protein